MLKRRNIIQLADISNYRSELMGWSILWIMMLHFGFYGVTPLGFVAQYGYAGVEIFMFLSGFGMYFSLDKSPSLITFYRRRLFRIFPAYYIIGLLTSFLIFHDTASQYLFRYTTIGFWMVDGLFADWFIPSILLLYLLSPFFKAIGNKGLAAITILILVLSFFLVELNDLIDTEHYFLLYRVPAFLYGMICANWLQHGRDMKCYYIIMLACLPFFVWLYPQFHQVYRYKYFSVMFMMPVFVCFFILVSKYIKILNPLMRRMGEASLEIYLTQGLFFYLIIHQIVVRSDVASFSFLIVSILSACLLHRSFQRKAYCYFPAFLAYTFIGVCMWYAIKWQPLLLPPPKKSAYDVLHRNDDTIRIAMYGDSWVGMHPNQLLVDTEELSRPFTFHTCGIGGLKSGEVYELMFSRPQLLQKGQDYCVVIAGINDASANVGVGYYCTNYQHIIEHLLACNIRPIVVEIPDVNLKCVYGKKPIKDLFCDSYRAFLTASTMYDMESYRKSLYAHLEQTGLMKQLIYIRKESWNPIGYKDESLYLTDMIHLNTTGYQKLDSCIVDKIKHDIVPLKDFRSHKKRNSRGVLECGLF